MNRMSNQKLTTPDLVLLSLLAEKPMYGYEANAQLESRKVRDWAGVSRPQIYYSLAKLAQRELLEATKQDVEHPAGPDRQVFVTTESGRAALAAALGRDDWTNQLSRPAFLTWLALSWQCRKGIFPRQLKRRREFLEQTLQARETTLQDVLSAVGHPFHEAVWMLDLAVQEIKTELVWLEKVQREAPRRAAAGAADSAGSKRKQNPRPRTVVLT